MDNLPQPDNGNDIPPPEPAQQPQPQMNVTVRDMQGNEVHFKLKPTTKLKKAMDAFSTRQDVSRQGLRFFLQGERVLDDSTPESLEMEDGDVIDVHVEQLGGDGVVVVSK